MLCENAFAGYSLTSIVKLKKERKKISQPVQLFCVLSKKKKDCFNKTNLMAFKAEQANSWVLVTRSRRRIFQHKLITLYS